MPTRLPVTRSTSAEQARWRGFSERTPKAPNPGLLGLQRLRQPEAGSALREPVPLVIGGRTVVPAAEPGAASSDVAAEAATGEAAAQGHVRIANPFATSADPWEVALGDKYSTELQERVEALSQEHLLEFQDLETSIGEKYNEILAAHRSSKAAIAPETTG